MPEPVVPAPSQMPDELRQFLAEVEQWVRDNQRDARSATIRFWALKTPALLSASAAGILGATGLRTTAAVLAAVASLCVLIDGVYPGGLLRNAFMRAVHELRALQNQVVADWRVGSLRGSEQRALAADILAKAQDRYQAIADELRTAETAFGGPQGR
jgi:hypothetical protein